MTQVTWRAPDELVERVRAAAARHGWSMNEYLIRVLDAATDADLADDEAQRVRERLARAGLLAPARAPRRRPDPRAVARARRSAGRGTELAELVASDRG